MPRAPIPTLTTISIFMPLWPCFSLRSATASPVGVDDGATAPSCVAVAFGVTLGTMDSADRSTGPETGGAVVVVDVSSFGFLSFSGLVGLVVVGAGAAVVGTWPATPAGVGAVVVVGPAGGSVVIVAGCVVVVTTGGAVVVVVALGSTTFTAPHMPVHLFLLSRVASPLE